MSSLSLAAPSLRDRLERKKLDSRLKIHSFHRYFGKLIPAIPAAAIEEFTSPHDTVLDPFCGSGTTLVEAIVRNRNAIGIDINPLSALISRVKTTAICPEVTSMVCEEVLKSAKEIYEDKKLAYPYCVNIHHWYRPKVIKQLGALHAAVSSVSSKPHREFLLASLSAINRNVSNADPQHVFPGYSKRLRKLDLERGRKINVFDTFASGVKKRIGYLRELLNYWVNGSEAKVHCDHADNYILPSGSVDLIVTNPPYISSVRYLETMKLEMSWAGYVDSPDSYRDHDRLQFGTERFSSTETSSFSITGIRHLDQISRRLYEKGQNKMSLTVSTYFRRMSLAVDAWDNMLKRDGKVVLKLSPSRVRDEVIPTPDILQELFQRKGYDIVEQFFDDYNQNSRSLQTARNYYSGRMDSDVILVMVKS